MNSCLGRLGRIRDAGGVGGVRAAAACSLSSSLWLGHLWLLVFALVTSIFIFSLNINVARQT